jgi:hypothetical protein
LQKLEENKLLINPKKYIFYLQKVNFLRYVITLKEIHINPDKVKVIKEWLTLITLKEL